jgi:hypothetical protein
MKDIVPQIVLTALLLIFARTPGGGLGNVRVLRVAAGDDDGAQASGNDRRDSDSTGALLNGECWQSHLKAGRWKRTYVCHGGHIQHGSRLGH